MGLHPLANGVLECVNGGVLIVADEGWCVLDGTCEPFHAMSYPVFWGERWHCEMVMPELQCIGDAGAFGLFGDYVLAAVVMVCHSYVPRCFATKVPRVAIARLLVGDDTAAEGSNRGRIVVEWSMETFPGRLGWIERGLTQKVKGEFRLRDEEIPQISRVIRSNAGEDRQEMRFEGADGSLSSIAAVDVGWHQLELGTPLICDLALIFSACFVVEDL